MNRISAIQKSKLISLIDNGMSLNTIAYTSGFPKSTVYHYFRKRKGRTIINPIINFENDKIMGEIIGIFTGDGSLYYDNKRYVYQVRIHFGGHNQEYMNYVRSILKASFNKLWTLKKDNTKRVLELKSKMVYNLFLNELDFNPPKKSLTVFLQNIKTRSKEFKIGFLKGLLDTDGTICNSCGKVAVYYTSSINLANQISQLLNEFKIRNGVSKIIRKNRNPEYQIKISRKDIKRYIHTIKPFKGR